MKIISPSVEVWTPIEGGLQRIERCARVCWKSEERSDGTPEGAEQFLRSLLRRGHESVFEHMSVTAKFTVDRGVSHEIVRHRLAAYCQESTRYCNYTGGRFGREITVIKPCFWEEGSREYEEWKTVCKEAERTYIALVKAGATPQEARSVLPNSLKTELVMTANIREWRHFLKLRTARDAHPQMQEAAGMALEKLKKAVPLLFDDIHAEACIGDDACDITKLLEKGRDE